MKIVKISEHNNATLFIKPMIVDESTNLYTIHGVYSAHSADHKDHVGHFNSLDVSSLIGKLRKTSRPLY